MAENGRPVGDNERYEPSAADTFTCEGCGGTWNVNDTKFWKTTPDRFWCDDCYDPFRKVKRAEELCKEIRNLIYSGRGDDGLSNEFHELLDRAQVTIADAVRRERLKRDQGIGPYTTEGDSK